MIGPDTYTVAAAANAGTDPVVLEATMKTQATAFCDQSKRKVEVVSSTPPTPQFVRDRASMTFKCVPPG